MSENKEDFALHCPVKNEEARKRLGIKAGFFWTTAKKLSVAISRCIAAMDDKGYDEDDFKKPVRVNLPVVNDLPPEGVFDTEFCNRYEKGGDDGKTMVLIPGAVPADPFHEQMAADDDASNDTASTDTPSDSDNTAGDPLPAYAYNVNGEPMEEVLKEADVSVATLPFIQRFLHLFYYGAGRTADWKGLHWASADQRRSVTRAEMDQDDKYIQNLLPVIRSVPELDKLDNYTMSKLANAIQLVFHPSKKAPQPYEFKSLVTAWWEAEPVDRGLLVKEWQKGNRVSCINRTPSGANAGGGIQTDRGEGFVHNRASLARDVATGVLARSMDVDIYNLHPAHAKRVDEIVADNKSPFDVFCKAFLNMPGGMDYSRAIVVASVKEAPTGIEVIPAHVTEYLNKVLTETDHASPDPLIVDIACGRTSQPMPMPMPMPMKGNANDDEEKPQPAGELADEQTAPETVEQDTTEHHPDPQPLDAQSQVDPVEVAYQKKRAELHEARKNIPPKNQVDAGKQLAAARGEYVEGISDPDDPKWVHNNYSASNEGEKTEVATDATDSVDHSEAFSNQHEPETSHSEPAADQNEPEMPQTGPEPQSCVPDDIKPGIYFDITNEAYHAGPGVSKSQLDDIAVCPAFYQWRKAAPVDTEKTKALDMGTALHCRLLEPDEFKNRFIIAPEFNRRTTAGKEEEKAFLENCANSGKTVMTAEEGRKLELMYGSVMAHPGCRALLEAEGKTESSIYWTDTETGELCRIRPDKFLANSPLILDVKKVADMSRFSRHVEEFRYHVQAAMYCEGWKAYSGETPKFAFLAVSESIDCGKYPVHLYILEDEHFDIGYSLFRRDLNTYHECKSSNKWGWGFEIIERPYWARG
ncbi:exonuclease VIII [Salmonella enterica]|nr:exonuclease VIII [Salmonella enterica]EIS6230506.1 PD-(D/E)XK nuclease-like domain-containing protein [Salmonella enterica]EIS6508784.1 PD-(D/E)XK nuclease-like domain-containing protein [Salmonella enterica]EIS6526155.1 PD-(D/E)XK nuclease-like domain-containing protein [Salmonella enterica]EIS6633688.1 PD-(D/E)XK nuclease-like domain-containing protein [Salmonella enterica]